jgi:hypothetical protein
VELHTSNNTLDKICELDKLGKELKRNPEKNISDPKFLKKIVDLSTNLREVIGPPARYSVPKKKSIESNVNSCIVDYHGTKVYFLYEPQTNENVAVYFGRDIFNSGRPRNLIVLNGEEYQDTLSRLLSLEMFKYSKNILNKKITVMRRMRDKAMRVSDDGKIDETYVNFLDSLESAESELSKIKNQSYLKKRLLSVEPELVEFMIYPAKEDPVVHELMNKLSWNSSLRRYHNTSLFISDFENADDEEKKYMLNEVQSNLLFNNQQNNDVNLWLYSTHHDFCDENKIKFNLINDDK